jgi:hypothetical protein
MANHLAISPSDGEILLINVQQNTGGSVQESVSVSFIQVPVGLSLADYARWEIWMRAQGLEAEGDAVVAVLEERTHPDMVAALTAATGVGKITSLSITPLKVALASGTSVTLGVTPVGPATTPPAPSPQSVTLSADAALGATSLAVTEFTPTSDWPIDASVNAKGAIDKALVDAAKADVATADAALAAALAIPPPEPPAVVKARAAKAAAEQALKDAEADAAADATEPTPAPVNPTPVVTPGGTQNS